MAVPIGTEEEAGGIEGMKALIDHYDGNLAAIARHLNVHRTSVLRVIKKYSDLEEHLEQARHAVFDEIENALITAAKNGCAIRQIFYLKTQGHVIGRPYNERPTQEEINGSRQIDAPITLNEWKEKQAKQKALVDQMLDDFNTIEGETIPADRANAK